jgi:MFS family permease
LSSAGRSDSWRGLYASGLLGRFVVLSFGIWLHAADSLVTATIAPAIVDDIGGVAFINWTIMLYEVGAIIAGAAAPMLCRRTGVKRLLGMAALVYGGGCLVGGLAPGDYIKLVQLQKELDEVQQPKEIKVTWVEAEETKSGTEE